MFSKDATTFDKILNVNWILTTYCQIDDEDFVNFCGLVRKHKLSELTMLSTIIQLLDPFLLLPLQLCLLDLDSFLFEMLWVVMDPSFNFGSYGLLKFSSKRYYHFWLSSLVRVFVLSYEDFSKSEEMQLRLHEYQDYQTIFDLEKIYCSARTKMSQKLKLKKNIKMFF